MADRNPRQDAIAERDRILMTLDQTAAKAFVKAHGAKLPPGPLNWERVLHLARLECVNLDPKAISDSRIWLARNGATSIATGDESREADVALNLIFPLDTYEAFMAERSS
jgi:hypothetical protein